jgi:hypothetical protein
MRCKIGLFVLLFLVASCDALTGPGRRGNVAVQFSTTRAAGLSMSMMLSEGSRPANDQLTVTGTNGTLVIDDIRFIVSELELKSSDGSCRADDDNDEGDDEGEAGDDDQGEDEDDCEFEGGPFIVDLPLEGNANITTQTIPPGTYTAFEFKIEDLEADDDDDGDERHNIPGILAEMRSVYPDFPSRASMVVKGTQNGQPFIVYFKSDLEVEQRIEPPLHVPQDQVLTVNLNPAAWFKVGDQVINLLALNGKLVEFGPQFKNGLTGARRGDD